MYSLTVEEGIIRLVLCCLCSFFQVSIIIISWGLVLLCIAHSLVGMPHNDACFLVAARLAKSSIGACRGHECVSVHSYGAHLPLFDDRQMNCTDAVEIARAILADGDAEFRPKRQRAQPPTDAATLELLKRDILPGIRNLLFSRVALSADTIAAMALFDSSIRQAASVWTRWVREDRELFQTSPVVARVSQLCLELTEAAMTDSYFAFSPSVGIALNFYFDLHSLLGTRESVRYPEGLRRLASSRAPQYRARYAGELVLVTPPLEPFDASAALKASRSIEYMARVLRRNPNKPTLNVSEFDPFWRLLSKEWDHDALIGASVKVMLADQIRSQICPQALIAEAAIFRELNWSANFQDPAQGFIFILQRGVICREYGLLFSRSLSRRVGIEQAGLWHRSPPVRLAAFNDALALFSDDAVRWVTTTITGTREEAEQLWTQLQTQTDGPNHMRVKGRAAGVVMSFGGSFEVLQIPFDMLMRIHDPRELPVDDQAEPLYYFRKGIEDVMGPLGLRVYGLQQILQLTGHADKYV